MLSKIAKLPILKRLIPSLAIRILKIIGKNRGYYSINGISMYLDFLDPIDREIILYNEFEKLEINLLVSEIKSKKLNYFLDVGANCGYYSFKIAQKISNINIFSFEPNPEAYLKFSKSHHFDVCNAINMNVGEYKVSDPMTHSRLRVHSVRMKGI